MVHVQSISRYAEGGGQNTVLDDNYTGPFNTIGSQLVDTYREASKDQVGDVNYAGLDNTSGSYNARLSRTCTICNGTRLNLSEDSDENTNQELGEELRLERELFVIGEIEGEEELDVILNEDEEESLSSMNTDPDINYFKNVNWSSDYISPPMLAKKIKEESEHEGTNLTLLHINCRSVLSKLTEIRELVEGLQISIVALSETWLDGSLQETIQIPGYDFIGKARLGERGGGVGFLVKDTLKFQLYEPKGGYKNHKMYESLFIRLLQKNSTPIIGVIYRQPGLQLHDFNDEFDDLVTGIRDCSKQIIIMGDFNIDLLKLNEHKDSNIFYNSLIAHHYMPTITKPTRITSSTRTLIDNIYCSSWSKLQNSYIVISDISDHLPIYASFSLESVYKRKCDDKTHRVITEAGKDQFKRTLAEMNWDEVISLCDKRNANEAYESFLEKYSRAYNEAFPHREVTKHKVKSSQPWMTVGLLKSCKKKNLLYIKYLKCPNQQNKLKFIQYRNKFKTVRINAEKNYYAEEFYKHHNDMKMTWKVIRAAMHIEDKKVKMDSLTVNGDKINDPQQIANMFNKYFTSIAIDLASKIQNSVCSFEDYMPPSRCNSMGLTLTSQEEIMKIGKMLKNPCSRSGRH